MPFAGRDVDP